MFFDGVGNNANNFTGGGFMPSQAAPEPQNNSGGQVNQRGGSNSRNQTLRSLTIKHLMKNIASTSDDIFTVDGQELNNVRGSHPLSVAVEHADNTSLQITVMGKVLSVNETSAVLLLRIDDGTGQADVKYWISSDENEPVPRHRSIQPGMYVKFHGHVRSMENKKHIVAFKMKKVESCDEITHHYLDCIFQHSYLTKKAQGTLGGASAFGAPGGSFMGGAARSGMTATPGSATQVKPANWGSNNFNQQQGNFGAPAPQAAAVGGGSCEQEVMAIYNSPEVMAMKYGLHQDKVVERLAHRFQPTQIINAVHFCLQEGHIYSTTDDNTFRTTMA